MKLVPEGDEMLRLLDRMLMVHPGAQCGKKSRPTAQTILLTVTRILEGSAPHVECALAF